MRLKFIICKVLQKEAYLCASRSQNVVDIVLMPQGLHNTPDKLRLEVQKQLDITTDVQDRPYDAILLGYGLCSNGIVGLSAKVPLVVPRAHDCITILLGSKERYKQYFDSHRGVYWYSPGWLESDSMPSKERFEKIRRDYIEKFGEENAEFLMQTELSWMKEYSWATFIDWNLPAGDEQKNYTRACAEFLGWQYDCLTGDQSLMQRLIDGRWNDEDFLVVSPYRKIAEDLTNPGIIKDEPING